MVLFLTLNVQKKGIGAVFESTSIFVSYNWNHNFAVEIFLNIKVYVSEHAINI